MNPTSGQGRGRAAGTLVADRLRAAGIAVEVLIGSDAADLRRLVTASLAADGPVSALVVVGGDGLVHLGAGLVVGTPVPLGIVAAGTGNDVARALGLPVRDPEAATEVLLRALLENPENPENRRRIDAVSVTLRTPRDHAQSRPAADQDGVRSTRPGGLADAEKIFLGVLGAGFDALVNERANGWQRPRGRARYVLAMLRELPVFRPRRYRSELDGQVLDSAAMLVAVANGPSYGGGMRVAPDARMDDGLLDVMVVEPLSRPAFLRIFPRVYAGTHVTDRRVSIRQGRRVTLDAPGIVAYADGERIGPLPLTCEILPKAVIVLAPRASETPGR